jgi:hypothetical protein
MNLSAGRRLAAGVLVEAACPLLRDRYRRDFGEEPSSSRQELPDIATLRPQ